MQLKPILSDTSEAVRVRVLNAVLRKLIRSGFFYTELPVFIEAFSSLSEAPFRIGYYPAVPQCSLIRVSIFLYSSHEKRPEANVTTVPVTNYPEM